MATRPKTGPIAGSARISRSKMANGCSSATTPRKQDREKGSNATRAGLILVLLGGLASAQSRWTPPKTPDGQPDLQGVWTNITLTPLERPAEFAGKPFLTPEEAAAYEKRVRENNNADRRDGGSDADLGRAYN